MYKYFMATVLFVIFVLTLEPAQKLLSNFLHLDKPVIHEIDEGDWFSKIALRNYGDGSYGKELAVINRAPDRDLIFPGEKVIVPSFDTIQKIRSTKRLSVVNQLVREQQEVLDSEPVAASKPTSARQKRQEPVEVGSTPSTIQPDAKDDFDVAMDDNEDALAIDAAEPKEASSASLMIFGIILAVIALAGGIFYFIRKKKEEDDEVNYDSAADDEEKESRTDRSIYFSEYESEKDDSNGKGYNKSKRKKEEEVEVA